MDLSLLGEVVLRWLWLILGFFVFVIGCNQQTMQQRRNVSGAPSSQSLGSANQNMGSSGSPLASPSSVPAGNSSLSYPSNASVAAPAPGMPILTAIGGWNSCMKSPDNPTPNPYGMNIYTPFKEMAAVLEQQYGQKLPYLVGCFSSDIMAIRFYSSDAPQALQQLSVPRFYAYAYQMARTQNRPLVAIGHSYGGWYAMDIARHRASDVRFKAIITVDPISPLTCKPETLARVLLSRFGITESETHGCSESPSDFVSAARVLVRQNAGAWLNYYQQDIFTILKATPIPEATENNLIQHQTITAAVNGHIALGQHRPMWQDIGQRLLQLP